MTWQCKLIANPERNEQGDIIMSKRSIGDMWFLDLPDEELRLRHLSDFYWANNSHRKPLVVLLPYKGHPEHKCYFLLDGKCYSQAQGHYGGWQVYGDPPLISITPSINMEGSYHGFLGSNGVPVGYVGDPL